MDINNVLENLGLKEGEIKVYLDLLKFGQSPVAKIKERTKLHRTTIYDFVESLLNKGLIGSITISGTREFIAKEPKHLFSLLEEKKFQLESIVPSLDKLRLTENKDFSVEVLKGKEAIKFWLNDVLNQNKDLKGFGFDEDEFEKRFKYEIRAYFKKKRDLGLKYAERLLTRESATFTYEDVSDTEYKYLPDEYFNPNPISVHGETVSIIIWEPMHAIIIKNRELADAYDKNFELLWKIANDKPGNNKKHL